MHVYVCLSLMPISSRHHLVDSWSTANFLSRAFYLQLLAQMFSQLSSWSRSCWRSCSGRQGALKLLSDTLHHHLVPHRSLEEPQESSSLEELLIWFLFFLWQIESKSALLTTYAYTYKEFEFFPVALNGPHSLMCIERFLLCTKSLWDSWHVCTCQFFSHHCGYVSENRKEQVNTITKGGKPQKGRKKQKQGKDYYKIKPETLKKIQKF